MRHTGKQVEEPMKKTNAIMRIVAVSTMALVIGATQARAAVTVYADEMPSNGAVTASSPVVETNVPAAQTNLNTKSRSGGDNPQVRIDETGVHIGGPNPVDINGPAFLRHNNMVWSSILAIVGSFGMPVFIIAIVFYTKHRRNRMTHETLRMMIEKGTPVTPELVATLRGDGFGGLGGDRTGRRQSGRLLPGLILTGVGTALLIADHANGKGGWIVLFIGVAFLVVWAVERKDQGNQPPPR
jgi:uncharacterized protein DUF6249